MLKYYQEYTVKKIIDNQKCLICWNRQSGKNYTINKFLEYYVTNNINKKILYICKDISDIKYQINKLSEDINSDIFKNIRLNYIDFINNNEILFSSINTIEKVLFYNCDYDLIIYDDIYKLTNIHVLNNYIDVHDCKCVFSIWFMDNRIFKIIDYLHDFYFSILSTENINKEELIYEYNKSDDYIDILDKKFERKYKLLKLNISYKDKLYDR